jgi:hypothetical protein
LTTTYLRLRHVHENTWKEQPGYERDPERRTRTHHRRQLVDETADKMSPPQIDPLDGLQVHPLEVQVAVLAAEVRNQRNLLTAVGGELVSFRRSLYSVTVALILFAATVYSTFH